jgi:AcrR family transcriptional regulator
MEGLRRDAARNRARIIEAAREVAARGEPLALNAVARAAEVGVGTVYRHFASVEELEEVLVWDRFEELAEILQASSGPVLEPVLQAHFALLAADELFEKVTARATPVLQETAAMREGLVEGLAMVLERGRSAREVRPGIDAPAVLLLMCGLAHAVRGAQLSPQSASAQALLHVVLRGLRWTGA